MVLRLGNTSGGTIFLKQTISGVELWSGDPSCQAAHESLLAALAKTGPFIAAGEQLTTRRQGNLGEFVALMVARHAPLEHTNVYAINAFQPLQDISHAGLDLTYLYFDPTDPSKDTLYIQEVKTTGDVALAYANKLTEDYQKLFEEDPKFTLNTRIQGLATKIELGDKRPDLGDRLRSLATTEAKFCTKVKLIPTLMHEKRGTDPVTKLLAVKTAISTLGWNSTQIQPWSVAFEDLISRLTRMARGQK